MQKLKNISFFQSFFLVILTLIFVSSCKSPLDGFQLGFKEPINKSSIRIQFSLPEEGKLPKDLIFKVEGRDADKIVTNLKTKNFKISKEGILILAVSPDIIPSTEKPIKITLSAITKDYLKIVKEISISNASNFSFYFGFIKKNAQGNSNANQIEISIPATKPIEINSFNNSEKIVLNIPESTVFLGTDNVNLSGKIDLILTHINSKSSKPFLPAGGLATNPVDKNNKPLAEPFDFIQSAALFSFEMSTVKNEIVRQFNQPLKVSMTVDGSIVNPITSKPLAVGDKVPLISYNPETGVWKVHGEVTISKSTENGQFIANFEVSHFGFWMIGWTRNICRTGPSFIIKSDIKDHDIVYYAQLVDAVSNQVIKDYYMSINNSSTLMASFIPKIAQNIKLKLYDYNNFNGGDLKKIIAESKPMPLCEVASTTLDLTKFVGPKAIELSIKIVCPEGKILDEAGLPAQMKMQISDPNKNNWKEVGTLTRFSREFKTYKMQLGKSYDLRRSTDGGVSWPYLKKNYLIDKSFWAFELPGNQYCK